MWEPVKQSPMVLLFALAVFCQSCKKDEPIQPQLPTIQLSVEEASCLEVWLRATTTETPATLALIRDNLRVQTLRLINSDSLLIDENLLPHHTYTYQLQRLGADSSMLETTEALQVTTMDTTSHQFTWETDTLGDASSVLYDVAIINDTLAYAVGEMYLRDSTGQIDPTIYNVAKWNGNRWELMRLQFYTLCNQPSTGSYPAKSIFASSPTDVWIGMEGSLVVHWNGQTQSAPMCTPVSINKIWEENPNSVWVVGNNGGIAHHNGTTWQRLESGTTLDFHDIWGARNPRTGELEILVLASTVNTQLQESKIVQITDNTVTPVNTEGLSVDMRGIWFDPGRRYYAVGAGIHQKRSLGDSLWVSCPPGVVTSYLSGGVRGTGINDVFVAGSFGEVVHFNGVS